ncbi:MAG: alpha-L-fucosidase [Paramuribaculum sp.]|nr:alpha-L-fucosidase [Paramuribaculum sp.]
MLKYLLPFIAAFALTPNILAQEYFEKELTFPAGSTPEQKIELASKVVPDERQKAWQDRELTAFLHFGINTFTGREWGDGKESPALFTPDALDTDQWVKTLSDAGFKMVIITAKHHDGFCLWPTATTDHSVASSPWREGQGDVIAELRKSCDKYDMKLGIYLSPWDRNASCYGDSPRYNDMFVAQLTELLSNYGKIDEVWFDGACGEGPNGKRQEYDWLRFRDTMKRLQPDAVLAITGDDVRWVGNESGMGRETEWSVTPLVPSIYSYSDSVNESLQITPMSKNIGDREIIEKADKLYWWPSEVDVSIRPGWFYSSSQEPHSLRRLADIYLQSIGRNSVLLLNIPPDTSGRINEKDVKRLQEFRTWIDDNFSKNLIDSLPATINTVVLSEDINHGQRVEKFEIQAYVDTVWTPLAHGTTIGKKRILTFNPVKTDSLRLRIDSWRGDRYYATIDGAYRITMPGDKKIIERAYPEIEGVKSTLKKSTLTLKADSVIPITGFVYTPSDDKTTPLVYRYKVEASNSGRSWRPVKTTGEFGNIEANPIEQTVIFEKVIKARYIRIECTESINGKITPTAFKITLLGPKQ